MSRALSPFVVLGSAAVLIIAVAGTSAAQSPPAVPSGNPAASPAPSTAAPTGSPAATAVGPITWQRVTKGKDFTSNAAVYGVGQLPDGRLVVVGSVGDAVGRPTGAAWSSRDGTKWSRVKIKTPKGSFITAVSLLGESLIAVGAAADGTGLLWTSADGSAWKSAGPPSGVVYGLTATASGLVGAGVDGGAATVWLTADGATWQPQTLAPSGRALHVAAGPDGSRVVAGAVTDAAGNSAPTVWTSTDGSTWTQDTLPGLAPGVWSIPAMALTPAGYVLTLSEPGQSGSIGHVWSSPDGVSWRETRADEAGSLSVVGTAGTDALLIGHGQVLRSSDGVTWTPTDEPSFKGWAVRDLMTLADGRLFAAGDAFVGQADSAMAVWTGEAAPAQSATPATAFDAVISMLGPGGEVSPEMALQAFALAVAPLPGVTPPVGAPGHLDADAAVAWVLQVWGQLSPPQQTAIERALEAMPDPFQGGGGAAASASGIILAALPPATAAAQPACGLFLTDPADPADVPTDIPAAVQPYLDQMQQAAASIAGHLGRPSLPELAVCLMPAETLLGTALTRVFDAQGARVGLPASCSIFLNAETIGGLDDGDVGYLMAFATFLCFQPTADRTESLASSGARRIPPWVASGTAAWAGATVATELFGGAGDRLTEVWTRYLTEPHVSLSQRTTDAIGFFAQVDQNQPTAWNVLDDAVLAGDTLGAFDALTGRRQSFIDQWAAGYFRDASRGPDWDIVGPGIPSDTAEAGSIEIANGEQQEMAAASMAVATADLSTSADITTFASNHLRIHDGVQDLKNVRNQAYCTREGGSDACACPEGTPGAGRPPLPPLGPEVKLALTGMEWTATAEIRGISLEEYCGPVPSVAPDCSIGIPAGEYDGTLVYTSILPGHPPIHDGSGKIRFAVDADGTVTGAWDLAYVVRSFTGQKGTGTVNDGVVGGTPRELLLSGTVVTAMERLGPGPVVPWPYAALTVQPVCDGQVVAESRVGAATVTVRASPRTS